MSLFKLTIKSIFSRKLTSLLLIISIGISTMLFIGVQKIKLSAKKSFSHSISGTDLIVGARSGDIQLLLYTVFRQGKPIANMSWESKKKIQALPNVKWLVPLSLGDSHRGYPVLGTNTDYFKHYKYGNKKTLTFNKGTKFNQPFDAVLGSEIAKKLNYTLNDTIVLSHGMAKGNLPIHKNRVFTIVGILKPTGTPVDKTVHVSLEGISAIHINWNNESKNKIENLDTMDLTPQSITGCLIGLKSKFSIFTIKQKITNWEAEPLMAIIPGLTLSTLWQSISTIDTAFLIITIAVTLIAFLGLLLGLFMSLKERKNELSILRIMGAHPSQLSIMLILESIIITASGVIFGGLLMIIIGHIIKPILETRMGLILSFNTISTSDIYFGFGIIIFGIITSLIPAILAYKKGQHKGFISI
ncbi:peptide ABC transporter permease [Candidatus Marinamargulisbacteria bacterium SCGC AG-343-K17]|nr:peptide ABC transporter permease [Candidatus Marinamargulisbacteria bacterium SCGC AG-343-K17]